jgi:hypothetical protein
MTFDKDTPVTLSEDLVHTYGHNGKLGPRDVWSAIDALEAKKDITPMEHDELTALKYIQQEQRSKLESADFMRKDGSSETADQMVLTSIFTGDRVQSDLADAIWDSYANRDVNQAVAITRSGKLTP